MADLRTALTDAIEQHREEPEDIVEKPEVPEQSAETIEKPEVKEKPRDESGKFSSKPEDNEQIEQPEQVQRPPRPNTWKKEYWESFDKLDPKLASYINEREHQIHTGIEQYR